MGVASDTAAPAVGGRALFETHCAQCHGVRGEGGYLGPALHAPPIAGAAPPKVVRQVRGGGEEMPAFSAAVLPAAALDELGAYVHEGLARPAIGASRVGPQALDPLIVGAVVWIALALFACGLALLFGEARN